MVKIKIIKIVSAADRLQRADEPGLGATGHPAVTTVGNQTGKIIIRQVK
jgi:hypothetical protein